MQEQLSEVFINIKGAIKYKWFAIGLAWIICLLGWSIVMSLPYKYTSVAKVHIDSTTLLQPLLKDIVIQHDGHVLVEVMKQLMFTVPNLNKIIALSNLDFLVANDFQRAQLYEDMKKDIIIKGKGRKKDGVFEVSYESNDPKMAKKVVNSILTVFSEETQLSSQEDVSNSQRFIDQQIKEYEVRLRKAEKAKENFKRANFGLLPEEGQGQITKLHTTYDQLEAAKLELNKAISKRNILIKQMQEVVDVEDSWDNNNSLLELSSEDQKIMDLQLRKTDLLLKYTENHPKVKVIKSTLKEVLKRKEQKDKKKVGSRGVGAGLPSAGAMANPYVQQLKITLNEAETEIASNKVRVNFLKKRIKKYNKELNLRLTIETKMQNLNRDYAITNENFQKLVGRREQARMIEKVDAETASIKFKIVDPANTPLSPSGPKRLLFLSGVLIMGLGSGFGFAYLLFYLKPTYITSRQLRDVTGLPILGNVSMQIIGDSNDKKWFFMLVSTLMSLILLYLGLITFENMRLHGTNPFNFINNKS